MKLHIRETQILDIPYIDFVQLKNLLAQEKPIEKMSEKSLHRITEGATFPYKVNNELLLFHDKCIFNQDLELVGIFTKLNRKIHTLFSCNNYYSIRSFFVNRDKIPSQFTKFLLKSDYSVNLLSNFCFREFTAAEIEIPTLDYAEQERLVSSFIYDFTDGKLDLSLLLPEEMPATEEFPF